MKGISIALILLAVTVFSPVLPVLHALPPVAWERTFGGSGDDVCQCVIAAPDSSGFVLAGYTNSFGAGGYDMYLVKTDRNGNFQWQRTFGENHNDYCYAVRGTTDGGYILGGSSLFEMYLVKTNSQGLLEWERRYPGLGLNAVCRDVHQVGAYYPYPSGYVLGGYSASAPGWPPGTQAYLVRTDLIGNVIWEHAYGGPLMDYCYSILPLGNGDITLAGSYESNINDYDAWILSVNAQGTQLWQNIWDNWGTEVYLSICQVGAGSLGLYAVAGYELHNQTNGEDAFFTFRESNGMYAGGHTNIGGLGNQRCNSIRVSQYGWSNNGYILGCVDSPWPHPGPGDMYVVRGSPGGFEGTFVGGNSDETCFSADRVFWDHNFIAAGYTNSYGAGGYDMYLVKLGDELTPVVLSSFSACQARDGVRLSWQTASEINCYGWTVQRRQNGADFSDISPLLQGYGTSVEPHDYDFLDQSAVMGQTYDYRLQQIDIDGTVTFYDPITVTFRGAEISDYKLYQNYPNPFNSSTCLRFTLPKDGFASLVVCNLMGQEITRLAEGWLEAGEHSAAFSGSDLPSGIYLARLAVDGRQQTVKLLLLR